MTNYERKTKHAGAKLLKLTRKTKNADDEGRSGAVDAAALPAPVPTMAARPRLVAFPLDNSGSQ